MHLLFAVLIGGLIRDGSQTVSLYPSGCWGDEAHIEGKVYSCTAVPILVHRICKLFLSPTVNTTGVTHNTTVCIKTNALTIFIPSAFYLISWRWCSKQKSSRELHISHHANTSLCAAAMTQLTLSLVTYSYLQSYVPLRTRNFGFKLFVRNHINRDNLSYFRLFHLCNRIIIFCFSIFLSHIAARI
jgi:hypothetical protein